MSTELLNAIESINFDILEHDEDCKKGYYQYLLRKMSQEISKIKKIEKLLLRPSKNSLDKQD